MNNLIDLLQKSHAQVVRYLKLSCDMKLLSWTQIKQVYKNLAFFYLQKFLFFWHKLEDYMLLQQGVLKHLKVWDFLS